MSIIIGVRTEKFIVIAADKQITSRNGTFETNKKLLLINNDLAFAGAGNYAFVDGVYKKLNEFANTERMTTEDILEIAKSEYKITKKICQIRKSMDNSFVDSSDSCCCFIAGLNKSSEPKLFFAYDESKRGYLSNFEVPKMISIPPDMTVDKCFNLLERNYKSDNIGFAEKTVKDVALISKYVSSNGEKWTYDLKRRQGNLESF